MDKIVSGVDVIKNFVLENEEAPVYSEWSPIYLTNTLYMSPPIYCNIMECNRGFDRDQARIHHRHVGAG